MGQPTGDHHEKPTTGRPTITPRRPRSRVAATKARAGAVNARRRGKGEKQGARYFVLPVTDRSYRVLIAVQ